MDFVEIVKSYPTSNNRKNDIVVYPEFLTIKVKDLIVRGGEFRAYWNGTRWSSSIDDLRAEVDRMIAEEVRKERDAHPGKDVGGRFFRYHSSHVAADFEDYCKKIPDLDIVFDKKIMFASDNPKREDYSTTQLNYDPKEMPTPAFDELLGRLYTEEGQDKIKWFMGALLTGKIIQIQKFLYLYGGKGSGKGTVIDIFKQLFTGYNAEIDLEQLTSQDPFATSQVQEVPLLIDPDSDISRIRKDVNLLKLTSHEPLNVNRKYTRTYSVRFTGLLITASNQRFKVRNINAGITRRAVVAEPTDNKFDYDTYVDLIRQIPFEIPGIAWKGIETFNELGASAYENETNVDMMMATDTMFDFLRKFVDEFPDPVTLNEIAPRYKLYLEDLGLHTEGFKRKAKEGLIPYYQTFTERRQLNGERAWNVYEGLKRQMIFPEEYEDDGTKKQDLSGWIQLRSNRVDGTNPFDTLEEASKAVYANSKGTPAKKWDDVDTVLADIDPTELHYVLVPENHIVIDFDLKDKDGNKDLELNLKRAAEFPQTYAEVSKSGQALHLHYIYDGDVKKLASEIEDGIEIKVYSGKSSLRRKLTLSNDLPIAHISTGLPLKEDEKVYDNLDQMVLTEKKIRTMIKKNLKKEYHAYTKPSMDFIEKILKDAQAQGLEYDINDMRQDILVFAMKSSHQRDETVKIARRLIYSTIPDEQDSVSSEGLMNVSKPKETIFPDDQLVFYDIEVFKNVLIVCWKLWGDDHITRWFNPTAEQLLELTSKPLVGFNNMRYDNHIIYNRMLGATNLDLFQQSQEIINSKKGQKQGFMPKAYSLAYVDVYDFAATKQSLKAWEVELGLPHDELEHDWNKPLPEEFWERAADYCSNDVSATEEVFKYLHADYDARVMLAEITGKPVSTSTNNLSEAYIFGDDKHPQSKFVYTDLSTIFPGYTFSYGKSEYRGENPGEGGYVYAEPGIYENVVEIDAESMHPTSIDMLNVFGPYTEKVRELKAARLAVKHGDFETAGKLLDGQLKPYLTKENQARLAYALKIVINAIYGMTSASFPNPFKDPRNIDNIVAKRGALFMIDLKHAVQEKGWTVVHIKTDSIKIADVTQEKIDFVQEFGKQYGYTFAVEHVFDKLALINNAVLIGHVEENEKWEESNQWHPIGKQFMQPYVLKNLFTHDKLLDKDFAIVANSRRGPIFIGKKFVGNVAQIYASKDGQQAKVHRDDGTEAFVTGTKKYLWKPWEDYSGKEDVNILYYDDLIKDSLTKLHKVEKEKGQVEFLLGKKTFEKWDS